MVVLVEVPITECHAVLLSGMSSHNMACLLHATHRISILTFSASKCCEP